MRQQVLRFAQDDNRVISVRSGVRRPTTCPFPLGFFLRLRLLSGRSLGRRYRYSRCPLAPDREDSGGELQCAEGVRGGRRNTAPWRTSICTRARKTARRRGLGRGSDAIRHERFLEFLFRSLEVSARRALRLESSELLLDSPERGGEICCGRTWPPACGAGAARHQESEAGGKRAAHFFVIAQRDGHR